jgi:chemotaxis protein CheD
MSGEPSGGGKAEVTIHVGGVYATREPTIIRTLLGSCVAVCLMDPITQVGGMNHFMLPAPAPGREEALDYTRFGVHAMDCLIGAIMKAGGDRRRLVAKVFGGAHVLAIKGPLSEVPKKNLEFVDEFLAAEGIPVLSSDVGGTCARHVHFHTGSGRAFVKRVLGSRARDVVEKQTRTVVPPTYGSVTLFE